MPHSFPPTVLISENLWLTELRFAIFENPCSFRCVLMRSFPSDLSAEAIHCAVFYVFFCFSVHHSPSSLHAQGVLARCSSMQVAPPLLLPSERARAGFLCLTLKQPFSSCFVTASDPSPGRAHVAILTRCVGVRQGNFLPSEIQCSFQY